MKFQKGDVVLIPFPLINRFIMATKIAIFKGKKIRKTTHNNEWWFSLVDVCTILTESADGGAYWRKLKQRLKTEVSEVVTICHRLKLEASDGKKYATDCANTEREGVKSLLDRMFEKAKTTCSQAET